MSRENVDAVYRAYDAIRRRDLHAFLDLTDPDVEGTLRVLEVEGAVYRGHEGMRRFAEEIWSVFPDWHPEVEEAREVGECVVAKVRGAGRGVGSGIDVGMTIWQVIEVRAGKAVWFQGYPTEEEALEAVRLREQAMSQKNIEVARRHYEAYNRQDLQATLDPLHKDIEIDLSATAMPETILRGHDQVAAVFTEQWKTTGAVEQRPQEFIELDDGRVLVPLQCWGKAGAADLELWMELTDVWTMRDGKGERIEVYPDRDSALKAVGLRE
jgi:ketosteroid isomerase-like protein